MVVFKKVTYKNFLSSGNIPIEIQLDKSRLTLISGKNGSGKSTIVESIIFGLFGKPYRNISKPQLVNSINQKQCQVQIEFSVGKKEYKVIRGMKPSIFEIYENGVLLNKNPNIKDHQRVLETQILKMNFKTFTQVVVMGSGNYVPFMELQTGQRREFIEDLLDIKVFSVMGSLVKDRAKALKDTLKEIEFDMKSLSEKAHMQKSFIEKRLKENSDSSSNLEDSICRLISLNSDYQRDVEKTINEIKLLESSTEYKFKLYEEIGDLKVERKRISDDITNKEKTKAFYKESDLCPTCKQDITDDVCNTLVDAVDCEISDLTVSLSDIDQRIKSLSNKVKAVESVSEQIDSLNKVLLGLNEKISINNALILKDRETLESLKNTSSINEEKSKLKDLAKSIVSADSRKKEVVEKLHYNTIAVNLLQDSGIKSKIIRQYIPVINKLINKYLAKLDFFVSFNLDEGFNETVKSRHRDEFTWGSFSEGQKMRINLALIFTWREIARMKNSINTNIVFFDELLDSSMDGSGMDLALGLLDDLKGSNVFVISHREGSFDKFPDVIQMTMKNNFTMVL